MVSAMNLHPLTPEQKNEYTRIAYYYYEAGQTQDQIAQRLGISRQRVNRILAECIERGIVRITVDRSPEEYFASESALEEKYRLKAVRLAHSLGADQLYGDLGVVPDSISSPSSSGEISSAAFPAAAWPGWWITCRSWSGPALR